MPTRVPHDDEADTDAVSLEFLRELEEDLHLVFENTNPQDFAALNAIRLVIGHVATERNRVLAGRCPSCGERHEPDEEDGESSEGETLQ